ncbi:hypothetical protein TELCIR_24697, partial [Teladorsagia circumcincta]
TFDEAEADRLVEERTFMWSWPFCTDGMAHGAYTRDKFLVCLPFNKGGTGEKNGTVSLFECYGVGTAGNGTASDILKAPHRTLTMPNWLVSIPLYEDLKPNNDEEF